MKNDNRKGLDPIDINDEKLIQAWYKAYHPSGSGPLGVMRVVTRLLEAIALEKGFTLPDIK